MQRTTYIEYDAIHTERGWLPLMRGFDSMKNSGPDDVKFLNHLMKKTKRGAIGAARRIGRENYPNATELTA